jgi:hypothetical protein
MGLETPGFDNLNEGVLAESILPEDINKVLQNLKSPAGEAEDSMDEGVSSSVDGEDLSDDHQLDLSAGEPDKGSDPVKLYLREMATVPLLKKEQEVSIAKRIESGQKRAHRAIARSPIAVASITLSKTRCRSYRASFVPVNRTGPQPYCSMSFARSLDPVRLAETGLSSIKVSIAVVPF